MANEVKTENVMLEGQTAYFRKTGSMLNHGTIEIANGLSSVVYEEGYIGPNSVLHGTDLATTTEYKECESAMKSYLGTNWQVKDDERTIVTNSEVMKSLLEPMCTAMEEINKTTIFDGSQLSYIRTYNAQYIDTGVPGNTVYGVEFTFVPYGNSNVSWESWLSGALDSFTLGEQDTTYSQCYVRWRGSEKISEATLSTSTASPNVLKILNNEISINGTTATVNTQSAVSSYADHIYICQNASKNRLGAAYIMRLKLYAKDNITLIRDMIPCVDYNGVACMWDNVTKQYFYNAGTGTFTKGTLVGNEYIPVEYIESQGRTYINTGITATNNVGFEIEFMPLRTLETTASYGADFFINAGGNDRTTSEMYKTRFSIDTYPEYPNGRLVFGDNKISAKIWKHQLAKIKIYNNKVVFSDGTTYELTPQEFSSNTLYLFGCHYYGGDYSANYAIMRLYSCKIWDGTNLVADIIPVKDKLGNACVYDKVRDKLIYPGRNQINMLAGPEIK